MHRVRGTRRDRRPGGAVRIAAALLVVAVAVLGCRAVGTSEPPATTAPIATNERGLPVVALTELPPEAARTVGLILAGGPFPYRQDGAVFENRERLLPIRPSGYYREYTVVTPGSDDRGARRIVAGADGEMYWTADHYDSFAWIAR